MSTDLYANKLLVELSPAFLRNLSGSDQQLTRDWVFYYFSEMQSICEIQQHETHVKYVYAH